MNRLIVLLLFFILISSPVVATSAFAESLITVDPKSQNLLNDNFEKSKTEQHSKITISVADGIYTNGLSDSNEKLNQQKSTVTKSKIIKIHIQETVSTKDLRENLDDIKQNSDRKALMERIWNTDKLRFNGKSFVKTDLFDSYQTTIVDERFNLDLEQEKNNLINTIERDNFIFTTYKNQPQDVVLVQTQNGFDTTFVEQLPLTGVGKYSVPQDKNGLLILFLSVPLVGMVFINSEQRKLEFSNFRKILSLSLSIILLSSAVTFPVSISTNYWGYAFGETSQSIVPPPVESIHFDNPKWKDLVNNGVNIFIDEDNPAAIFDGKDNFLQIPSSDISKELDSFTISAWVKPNYDSGSQKLSVISMKNAFELSINNNLEPEKIATFSIFDGIKWHSVQSYLSVDEEWTHLTATFDDSSISIFVNGQRQNTLDNIRTVSVQKGQSVVTPLGSISAESDIFVGVFQNSADAKFSSYYSGLIDSIEIFDSVLGLGQISALNEKNRESGYTPTLSDSESEEIDETFEGEPNQFGFVADKEQNNSQEIEEEASKGFQIKKEEKKKKKTLLIVITNVTNNNGSAVASDFRMSVSGNNPTPASFQGAEEGRTVSIGPGFYEVRESGLVGYTSSFSADCSGKINNGETKTCTVTNNDIQEFSDETTIITSSDTSTEFSDETTVITSSDTSTESSDTTQTTQEFSDQTIVETSSSTDTTLKTNGKSGATLETDKQKYNESETVIINGAGFIPNTSVHMDVTRDGEPAQSWIVASDDAGAFQTNYFIEIEGKLFVVTATDGTNTATTNFIDPHPTPSFLLEQCRNGGDPLNPEPCSDLAASPTGWVTGNTNDAHGHWVEGQFIPYRLEIGNLLTGGSINHSVVIGYDTIKSGKHAIDYVGSWNFTETNALGNDPCRSITTCDVNNPDDIDITLGLPNLDFIGFTNVDGKTFANFPAGVLDMRNFTAWNATITSVEYEDEDIPSGGTKTTASTFSTQIRINFTANDPTVLLTWGGHIGSSLDWGAGNSAVDIGGSPYHTFLVTFSTDDHTGPSPGNKEVQLAASAVMPSGTIIIIKDTDPDDPQDFTYSTTGGLTPSTFTLDDEASPGSDADSFINTQTYTGLIPGSYTVTEDPAPTGFFFVSLSCTEDDTTSLTTTSGTTATIELDPGETVTCTYLNNKNTVLSAPVADILNTSDVATATIESNAQQLTIEKGDTILTMDAATASVTPNAQQLAAESEDNSTKKD